MLIRDTRVVLLQKIFQFFCSRIESAVFFLRLSRQTNWKESPPSFHFDWNQLNLEQPCLQCLERAWIVMLQTIWNQALWMRDWVPFHFFPFTDRFKTLNLIYTIAMHSTEIGKFSTACHLMKQNYHSKARSQNQIINSLRTNRAFAVMIF